jgi:transcriptional regulator with XRE-family HTH domain
MCRRLGDLVAANVRAERGRHGWRQQQLADRLDTSQSTVSQIEAGRRRLDVDDLLALCQALQVPLARLLVGATDHQLQLLATGTAGPPTRAESTDETDDRRCQV